MSEYYRTIENLTHTGNVVKSIKGKLQHIEKKLADSATPVEKCATLINTEGRLKTELCAAYVARDIARNEVNELFASMRG